MGILRRGRWPLGRSISRRRDGSIAVDLEPSERDALRHLLDELRGLLTAGDSAGLRRLYPTAYPHDERLEDEYRQLVHDSLLEQRLATIDEMESTLDRDRLSDDELGAWMATVNSLRLVLGTMLDVSEDDDGFDPDAPDAGQRLLYGALGYLLEQIVDVLAGGLPD